MPARRSLLAGAALALLARPAGATPEAMRAAILGFTNGVEPGEGGVELDIPPLVENGNTVPMTVRAEGAVRAIAVFNERNPQPHVITARFGPRAGRAELVAHVRLATSQKLWAVAALADGGFRLAGAEVIVTLAACVEG